MASRGMLDALVGTGGSPCALQSLSVEAREDVPPTWFERYAFAIVRRGAVLRQRIDPDGGRTAIDVAGPGALVPLRLSRESELGAGHAVTRTLLCVYPEPALVHGDDPRVLADLLALSQQALDRLEGIAAARGRASSTEKVRALLDSLAGAFPPPPGAARRELPLTQRDLAELLHMRPETVCRALGKLARDAREPATPAEEITPS